MMIDACSTQEAEARGLQAQGQPGLHNRTAQKTKPTKQN